MTGELEDPSSSEGLSPFVYLYCTEVTGVNFTSTLLRRKSKVLKRPFNLAEKSITRSKGWKLEADKLSEREIAEFWKQCACS